MYILKWKDTTGYDNAVVGEYLTMNEEDSTSSLEDEDLVLFDAIKDATDPEFPGNLLDSLGLSRRDIDQKFSFQKVQITLVANI